MSIAISSTHTRTAYHHATALPLCRCLDCGSHVQEGLEVQYVGVVQHVAGELASTVAQVRALGLEVRSVMVGCETGVNLNDELCDALGLVGNSIAHTALRR